MFFRLVSYAKFILSISFRLGVNKTNKKIGFEQNSCRHHHCFSLKTFTKIHGGGTFCWFWSSSSAAVGATWGHHHRTAVAEVSCSTWGRYRDAPGWSLQPPVSDSEHSQLFTHPSFCFIELYLVHLLFSGSPDHPMVDGGTGNYRLRHAGGHWLCNSSQSALCGQVLTADL